jgi:glutathione S-transferase
VADYTRWFLSRLRHVERALETAEYFCAERFTGADISVGYALLLADRLLLRGAARTDEGRARKLGLACHASGVKKKVRRHATRWSRN